MKLSELGWGECDPNNPEAEYQPCDFCGDPLGIYDVYFEAKWDDGRPIMFAESFCCEREECQYKALVDVTNYRTQWGMEVGIIPWLPPRGSL